MKKVIGELNADLKILKIFRNILKDALNKKIKLSKSESLHIASSVDKLHDRTNIVPVDVMVPHDSLFERKKTKDEAVCNLSQVVIKTIADIECCLCRIKLKQRNSHVRKDN